MPSDKIHLARILPPFLFYFLFIFFGLGEPPSFAVLPEALADNPNQAGRRAVGLRRDMGGSSILKQWMFWLRLQQRSIVQIAGKPPCYCTYPYV